MDTLGTLLLVWVWSRAKSMRMKHYLYALALALLALGRIVLQYRVVASCNSYHKLLQLHLLNPDLDLDFVLIVQCRGYNTTNCNATEYNTRTTYQVPVDYTY